MGTKKTDDLKNQIAEHILSAFGNDLSRTCVTNTETARMWIEQAVAEKAKTLPRFPDERIIYRTCVRPGDKTVHMQLRGPADLLEYLTGRVKRPEPDDSDEQMCDDWTNWEEV